MNNLRWITMLFNNSGQVMRLFQKRRNPRMGLWITLLTIGVSALSLGLTRGRKPIQNMVQNVPNPLQNMNNPLRNMNMPAFVTEFAKELAPQKQMNQNANNTQANINPTKENK